MKKTTILVAAGLALIGFGAHAQKASDADPNGNLIGLTAPNGKLVYDFINMWFNEHKAVAAWDKYVARKGYMNHAVYNATTKSVNKTFEEEKAEEARAAGPGTIFKIVQLVSQGNLVFVHIAASRGEGGVGPATGVPATPSSAPPGGAPTGPGPVGDGKGPDEMVMILRVNNGKIVDHWDMHIPTNSDSVVFEGLDRKLP